MILTRQRNTKQNTKQKKTNKKNDEDDKPVSSPVGAMLINIVTLSGVKTRSSMLETASLNAFVVSFNRPMTMPAFCCFLPSTILTSFGAAVFPSLPPPLDFFFAFDFLAEKCSINSSSSIFNFSSWKD